MDAYGHIEVTIHVHVTPSYLLGAQCCCRPSKALRLPTMMVAFAPNLRYDADKEDDACIPRLWCVLGSNLNGRAQNHPSPFGSPLTIGRTAVSAHWRILV